MSEIIKKNKFKNIATFIFVLALRIKNRYFSSTNLGGRRNTIWPKDNPDIL